MDHKRVSLNILMESISMEEVREIGKAKGILSVNKFERKVDLIRTIRLADGREPCFMAEWGCSGRFCMWVEECGLGRETPVLKQT